MDLADKIIQANDGELMQKERGDAAPDGYYTDDLGLWVEVDIRKNKHRFARYIALRCRLLNPHLYYDPVEMVLYNRHVLIEPTTISILSLARTPDMINPAQAIWVYDKLKESAPRLTRDFLLVGPDLAWNYAEGRLEEVFDYCSVGGEDDT